MNPPHPLMQASAETLYHPWFERFASPIGPLASPQLLALRSQPLNVSGKVRRFFDVVLSSGPHLRIISFCLHTSAGIVFPRMARHIAPHILNGIAQAAAQWLATVQVSDPLMVFGVPDAEFGEFARAQSRTDILPGSSLYGLVMQSADRYTAAAAEAGGRRVIDLLARTGFGLAFVRRIAAEVAADPAGSTGLARSIGERAGYLAGPLPSGPYDVALALDLQSEDAARVLARVQMPDVSGAHCVVHTRFEAVLPSFTAIGFTARPFELPWAEHGAPQDVPLFVLERNSPDRSVAVAAQVPSEPVPAVVNPRPLSILFGFRSNGKTHFGGDVIHVEQTAAALRRRGHRVEISLNPQLETSGFDVVHLTNINAREDTLAQAESVRSFAGPVVLLPIFVDHAEEGLWGLTATEMAFSNSSSENELSKFLAQIADRTFRYRNEHQQEFAPPPMRLNVLTREDQNIEIVRRVDYLTPTAHTEVALLLRHINSTVPFAVIPSGVDHAVTDSINSERFLARFGLRDFVFLAGRIEGHKNQIMTMRALRDRPDRPLVLAGRFGGPNERPWFEMFLLPGMRMLGFLPPELIGGAMAAARVVVVPSWNEVESYSALFAAAVGTSLAVSRNAYAHEYLEGNAEYLDPGNPASIMGAIDRAWQNADACRPRLDDLAAKIRRERTWDRAAVLHEQAYHRVLAYNPRGDARRARTE